jgi:murein DD-endopeptidase MepM/ murein hydrolase activator NlpD
VLLSSAPEAVERAQERMEQTHAAGELAAPPQEAPATPEETASLQPPYFTYTIQPGDTVDSIAGVYGIDPTYIIWNNPEITDPDSLIIGGTLLVPSVDGVVYHLALGDTLTGVAAAFGVDVSAIVDFGPNALTSPDSVPEGMVLVIPGAVPPAPAPVEEPAYFPAAADDSGSGYSGSGFIWPWYAGVTQYFGEPELGSYHKGVDLEGAGSVGAPIVAAAAGTVILTAWDDYGLGYHVIIDHGNGFQTIYAHLSDIWVGQGQYVSQGEAVGALGSTGYSTGPHLHFQINLYGSPVDPLAYLP